MLSDILKQILNKSDFLWRISLVELTLVYKENHKIF